MLNKISNRSDKALPLLAVLLLFSGAHPTICFADEREHSQQFFNTYCVSCHGQSEPEADLRLDHIDTEQ